MKRDFMKEWKERAPDPVRLSRNVIFNDKYDCEDAKKLVDEMNDLKVAREKLADSKAGPELAYDVMSDLYWSLVKVDPNYLPDPRIRPSHLINKAIMNEAEDLPSHRELYTWTVGDPIGAALACITMEPDMETLYDRLEEQIKQAMELDQTMQQLAQAQQEQRDIDEMFQQWTEENPDAPEQEANDWRQKSGAASDMVKQLREQMEAQGKTLQEALENARPEIRAAMRQALGNAADEVKDQAAVSEMWGMEPGSLHRLPAEERIALAKRMNNKKFRRIADLFGSIKRFAFAQQRRKVNYAREEIFDIELGNDLNRVLPSELAKIGDEDREVLFLSDYVQRRLPQYKLKGHERVARGGVIYLHDGSGSMGGDKEIWAKAVGLALLHIAKKQRRPFFGIQFSSRGQIRCDDFRDANNIDANSVIDFAEYFFGGGTDFMTPLSAAVEILREEAENNGGALKSDIVFATDGICDVTDDWLKEFKKAQKDLDFKIYGIIIGGTPRDEPLRTICDGRVASVKSLVDGKDVADIFASI